MMHRRDPAVVNKFVENQDLDSLIMEIFERDPDVFWLKDIIMRLQDELEDGEPYEKLARKKLGKAWDALEKAEEGNV